MIRSLKGRLLSMMENDKYATISFCDIRDVSGEKVEKLYLATFSRDELLKVKGGDYSNTLISTNLPKALLDKDLLVDFVNVKNSEPLEDDSELMDILNDHNGSDYSSFVDNLAHEFHDYYSEDTIVQLCSMLVEYKKEHGSVPARVNPILLELASACRVLLDEPSFELILEGQATEV